MLTFINHKHTLCEEYFDFFGDSGEGSSYKIESKEELEKKQAFLSFHKELRKQVFNFYKLSLDVSFKLKNEFKIKNKSLETLISALMSAQVECNEDFPNEGYDRLSDYYVKMENNLKKHLQLFINNFLVFIKNSPSEISDKEFIMHDEITKLYNFIDKKMVDLSIKTTSFCKQTGLTMAF